jgi:hypothetical protein
MVARTRLNVTLYIRGILPVCRVLYMACSPLFVSQVYLEHPWYCFVLRAFCAATSILTYYVANIYVIYSAFIVAGIATRYGLDGPGIESRWGTRFSAPVQTDPGAHPASYTMGTGSLPGVKRPGRDIDHPLPSGAEVKERVELYLYSPFGPSSPVLG